MWMHSNAHVTAMELHLCADAAGVYLEDGNLNPTTVGLFATGPSRRTYAVSFIVLGHL